MGKFDTQVLNYLFIFKFKINHVGFLIWTFWYTRNFNIQF
jgi:hypothetical protein